MHGLLLVFGLVAGGGVSPPPCAALPTEARQYLAENPGWRVLTLYDLSEDDRKLWVKHHRDACPGAARARLAAEKDVYALALLSRRNGHLAERLIFIDMTAPKAAPEVIESTDAASDLFVVWKVAPGASEDVVTGAKKTLRDESFIYEQMEAQATQYYFAGGRYRRLTTAR
jgi:hypothetical protein